MVDYLVGLPLGLQVMEKHHRVDSAAKEDEDSAAANLHDGDIEHVLVPHEGQFDEVVDVADAEEFLPGERLDEIFEEHLLEFPCRFVLMLEDFLEIGVISSSPLGLPQEADHIDFGQNLLMHIFEMEHVGTIFGDVLDVAVYIMDGLSPVLQRICDRGDVDHGIDGFGLVFSQGMDPHVNIPVDFRHGVLPQPDVFFLVAHPLQLVALLAEVLIVFNIGPLDWPTIVI